MNRFRRSVYHRLLALALLVGLGTWLSAPFVAAHPQTAAQVARTFAGGPLEDAVAEALVVAAKHASPSDAFVSALQAALEAHPEGKALAEFLAEHYSPELLFDLLVGQLLRSQGAHNPLMLAAAVAHAASPALSGSGTLAHRSPVDAASASSAALRLGEASLPVLSIWELSAAQPLGP